MTTNEISKMLGISRATVSRVLNNSPHVKPETRERVLRAIAQEGYAPNLGFRTQSMTKITKIGVVVFSEPASFWAQIKQGVDKASEETAHLGVQIDYFVTDILRPEDQIETIDRLVAEEYQGIALAPNDPGVVANAIDRAIAAGVAVVLFNVDIPNVNRMAYVGSDYTRAGMLAAELLAKTMPSPSANVAIMTLEETLLPIEQRTTGFRLALAEYTDVKIAQVCRFPRVDGDVYQRTQELIASGSVQGIFVTFGGLSEAARAIQHHAVPGKITLVGYDLDTEIAQYLKKGVITATIGHEVQGQSYKALNILCSFLQYGAAPKQSLNYTKLEVITRYNADGYLQY